VSEPEKGKRVSWVELYFDLVFVFAVSQVAHAIVESPTWGRVGASLGLFATLWWTWIGFAVLYNRQGDNRKPLHRVFVLVGTVPCAIAATQAHHLFGEDPHQIGFALALAGARLVLAAAHGLSAREQHHVRRIGWGYGFSFALFTASAFVHPPWCYVLWAVALTQEGTFLLLGDRTAQAKERRKEHRRMTRAELMRATFAPPANPATAVDAAHLSERFGLFMIILLGELVITVGAAALDRPDQDLAYWLSLIGGLVLAGALWWVYFDSAVDLNERLLSLSGGNPALAYSLYAAGHLTPAFALVTIAAGVNLSLHEEPAGPAPWFITAGLAVYFGGTRVFSAGSRKWWAGLLRLAAIAGTVNLALLGEALIAPAVVAAAALWAVGAAAIITLFRRRALHRLEEDPVAFFREGR
jgi:low temperature requirement protein LtrA